MNRKAEIKFHRQQIRHHQLKLAELMAPELGVALRRKEESRKPVYTFGCDPTTAAVWTYHRGAHHIGDVE